MLFYRENYTKNSTTNSIMLHLKTQFSFSHTTKHNQCCLTTPAISADSRMCFYKHKYLQEFENRVVFSNPDLITYLSMIETSCETIKTPPLSF